MKQLFETFFLWNICEFFIIFITILYKTFEWFFFCRYSLSISIDRFFPNMLVFFLSRSFFCNTSTHHQWITYGFVVTPVCDLCNVCKQWIHIWQHCPSHTSGRISQSECSLFILQELVKRGEGVRYCRAIISYIYTKNFQSKCVNYRKCLLWNEVSKFE